MAPVTDDECMHLLDPATCTICNGRDTRERAEHEPVWSYPVKARFDGHCHGCNLPITRGEPIRIDERHIHPARHAACT